MLMLQQNLRRVNALKITTFCHGLQLHLRGRGACTILAKVAEKDILAYEQIVIFLQTL